MNALRPSLRNDSFVSFVAGILVTAMMLIGGPTAYAYSRIACDAAPPTAVVEETNFAVLTPTAQFAHSPFELFEQIFVLEETPVPVECVGSSAEILISGNSDTPERLGRIDCAASIVSIAFWDCAGSPIRFGYGIRSEIVIDIGDGSPAVKSSAFKLIGESQNEQAAIDGGALLIQRLDQLSSNPSLYGLTGDGGIGSTYSECVRSCLSSQYAAAIAILADCADLVQDASFLIASECGLVCVLLGGPAWLACVGECLLGLGALATGVGAACLAAFLATLATALIGCRIGCIGV